MCDKMFTEIMANSRSKYIVTEPPKFPSTISIQGSPYIKFTPPLSHSLGIEDHFRRVARFQL